MNETTNTIVAITYENIETANRGIKTTNIKGKAYAEVKERIKAFRKVFPLGQITTEMVSNENGVCIFKATVSDGAGNVLGTGTSYEKENSSNINTTSFIENCETSAVGRALGMCGFGIDTSLASADETKNAMRQQKKSNTAAAVNWRTEFIKMCKEKGIDSIEFAQKHGINKKTTQDEYKDIVEDLKNNKYDSDETVSLADL